MCSEDLQEEVSLGLFLDLNFLEARFCYKSEAEGIFKAEPKVSLLNAFASSNYGNHPSRSFLTTKRNLKIILTRFLGRTSGQTEGTKEKRHSEYD